MQQPDSIISEESQVKEELTIDEKLDKIGEQMNWLVDNLSSLFVFAQSLGNGGGGIRGLLSAIKQGGPQLTPREENSDGA